MGVFSFKNNNQNHCPYCSYYFDFTPQNKVKCPECNKNVFVHKNRKGIQLITEQAHTEMIVIHYMDSIGFSQKNYENYKANFFNNAKEEVCFNDFLWSLYGHLLSEKAKTEDYSAMHILYSQMATMQIDNPAEYLKLRKLAGQMELLSFKKKMKTEFEVEILPTKNSCDYCKTYSNKRFSPEKALEELPLPLENCTQGAGCRCCYGIIPKEEL
jgi:hypothetical protein